MWNPFKKQSDPTSYFVEVAAAKRWIHADEWLKVLAIIGDFIESPLIKLDSNDQLRKRSKGPQKDADYIVREFIKGEYSIFGEFADHQGFTIECAKNDESYSRLGVNCIELRQGATFKDFLAQMAKALGAFYGRLDTMDNHRAWKKKRAQWGIDYCTELPGVAHLTFFNHALARFFGIEKFAALDASWIENGVVVTVPTQPLRQRLKRAEAAESLLGANSFVNHRKLTPFEKTPGKYLPPLSHLRKPGLSTP